MKLALLALAGTAVALTAVPAEARHYSNVQECVRYHHGRCIEYRALTRHQARRAGFDVGYNFGPSYSYTEYSALPQPVVTRYHLRDRDRYVYENGNVYVVNPRTYRVVRVIRAG